MRTAVRSIASLLLGVALLAPLGALYGFANLPVYHSWGLAHGSFATAIPASVLACYVALGLIPWFGGAIDVAQRLVACASVLVLVTSLFYADQASQFSVSRWHLAIYLLLAGIFALLAVRARRPKLLPLFLIVPLSIDPLFGFAITAPYGGSALDILGRDVVSKVLPAAVAAFAGTLLTRFACRSGLTCRST